MYFIVRCTYLIMNSRRHRLIQLLCTIVLLSSQLNAASENPRDSEELQARGSFRYVYGMLFKLYDTTLYTDAPQQVMPATLLNGRHAVRLEFSYLRTIKKAIILESAEKMLRRNLSPSEFASIADRVDTLNSAYTTVHKGDRSSLSYQAGHGTQLNINGKNIISISGDDFGPLYLRIWLGERPISTDMRDSLLSP